MAIGSFRVRPRRPGLVGPSIGVLVTVLGQRRGRRHRRACRPAPGARAVALPPGDGVDRVRPGGRPPIVARARRALGGAHRDQTCWSVAMAVHDGARPRHRHRRHRNRTPRGRRARPAMGVRHLHRRAGAQRDRARGRRHWRWQSRGRSGPIGPVENSSVRSLSTWMFVAVVQGGIGYLQYFTGVPELLVGAHIAGATALWVVTVWLWTALSGDASAVHRATVGARPSSRTCRSEVQPRRLDRCSITAHMGTELRRRSRLPSVCVALGFILLAFVGTSVCRCGRRSGPRPGERRTAVDHRPRAESFRTGRRAGRPSRCPTCASWRRTRAAPRSANRSPMPTACT